MQSVEVTVRVGGSVRDTSTPKALSLFCLAHNYCRAAVELMSSDTMDDDLDYGRLHVWTDEDADQLFANLAGRAAPIWD